MSPKIESIRVERFRAFRKLEIQGLGRVNLIVGKNNTGKSSLLEALRLLASDANPRVITSILKYREEDRNNLYEEARKEDPDSLFLTVSSLFNGFPHLAENPGSIVISTNGKSRSNVLRLRLGWYSEERDIDGRRRLVEEETPLNDFSGVLALVAETGDAPRIMSLERLGYPYRRTRFPQDLMGESYLPCTFVSPYGEERTEALGHLWDRIALSDQEEDVVNALRIIDPRISAVSMIGEGGRRYRTAIVRAKNIPRPVSLRSFGDGVNRLFGIILSLVNAENGFLLIDEFENGLHHGVQHEAWRTIFEVAERLNIQVFATSHSWDAIEAFQKAAAETAEDGALVRLTHRGDNIIPTVFAKDELAVATRDRIEVR